jgi:hypothetical protein
MTARAAAEQNMAMKVPVHEYERTTYLFTLLSIETFEPK